jgi:transporter family protein
MDLPLQILSYLFQRLDRTEVYEMAIGIVSSVAMTGRILLLGYERIVFKQASKDHDTLISTFWLFFLAAVFQIPLLFFYSWTIGNILSAALSAAIYTITFSLYVYALSHYEVSLVTPFYNFNVFFLLLLSVLFLQEPFTWWKLGGIVLLFYGTTFLERDHNLWSSIKAVYRNRGCQLMILSSLLMAVGRINDRRMIETTHPAVYSFALYFMMGVYLIVIIAIQGKLKPLWHTFRESPKPYLLGGATNAYSYLFMLLAFTEMDVSVAEPLSMLSVLLTMVLSAWILKERVQHRLIGGFFMVLGAILLIV